MRRTALHPAAISLTLALPLTGAAPASAQLCRPFWANAGIGLPTYPLSMAVHDDGAGPAVFMSLVFNGVHALRWNGASWVNIDTNLPPASTVAFEVTVLDNGSGPAVYATGNIQNRAGITYFGRRWTGSQWAEVPPGLVHPDGLAFPLMSADLGDGPHIYGRLQEAPASFNYGIGRWNGSTWEPLTITFYSNAFKLLAFDDGAGPRLYALGSFVTINGVEMHGFARWLGGTTWERPPSNHSGLGNPRDVAVFDGGSGPAIFAHGTVYLSGGSQPIPGVGRWDGSTWVNLGGPDLGGGGVYTRTAMEVFDDGTGNGPALYVTGGFNNWAGIEARGIVKWDGAAWSPVIRGIFPGSEVRDMVSGVGPHGPALYVGGSISQAGAGTVRYVAEYVACPNCYANCDWSTTPPRLNVQDFLCFLNRFAADDPYANCDQSTDLPGLTVLDFQCFLNQFAAGCP